MKKILASIGMLIIGATLCAEEKPCRHYFTPKLFYRFHDEENYKYNTYGVGLHYFLKKPTGLNVKLSVITNPQSKMVLSELENTLFYKLPSENNVYFYPILSHRFSFHNIDRRNEKKYYINKQTFFAGAGAQLYPSKGLLSSTTLEIQLFRDLFNAVWVTHENEYWGRSFSNPFGARGKIKISHEYGKSSFWDVEGYYAFTFPHCYKEIGCEVSFNWGF